MSYQELSFIMAGIALIILYLLVFSLNNDVKKLKKQVSQSKESDEK